MGSTMIRVDRSIARIAREALESQLDAESDLDSKVFAMIWGGSLGEGC